VIKVGRIGALLACALVAAPSRTSGERASETHPNWTANLNEFSYRLRPNPHYMGGRPYIGGKFVDLGVAAITASNEILCYFVTKTDAGQLERRESLGAADPFQLQLVFFDSTTGRLKRRRQLPARSGFSSVMINNEGNLIVRSGNFLRLYSRDLVLIKERPLELTQQVMMDEWRLRLSTSGKTLLLNHYSPSGVSDEVLDASSLQMLLTLKAPKFRDFSIAEKTILKSDRDHKQLFIRRFDGFWQELIPKGPLPCVSSPVLIDDEIVLNACGHEVLLLSTKGDVLMRDVVGKNEHLEELVSVTPNGRFFAASVMQTKGGFMDYTSVKRSHTRVLVYDTVLRKRIASVQIDPIPKTDYDFALAPDGSKLAVMIDSQLDAYVIRR
jgi:hypothetical protein